jgi:hypothetical protein
VIFLIEPGICVTYEAHKNRQDLVRGLQKTSESPRFGGLHVEKKRLRTVDFDLT